MLLFKRYKQQKSMIFPSAKLQILWNDTLEQMLNLSMAKYYILLQVYGGQIPKKIQAQPYKERKKNWEKIIVHMKQQFQKKIFMQVEKKI